MITKQNNEKIKPNFLEYARKVDAPLANVYGKGVEGLGVLIDITSSQVKFRMETGVEVSLDLRKIDERESFVMISQYLEDKIKLPFNGGYGDINGHYIDSDRRSEVKTQYFQQGCDRKCTRDNIPFLKNKDKLVEFKELFPKVRDKAKFKKYSRYGEEIKTPIYEFFGAGAMDIKMDRPEDFVDALAYISAPGNTSIIADVPPNHEENFVKLYPYAHFGHTVSHNGGTCQFTIAIHGSKNLPHCLHYDVMPSDQFKIGSDESIRIIRSAFTYDLVENRGFQFGKEQDANEILSHIPEQYKDYFKECYQTYSGIDLDSEQNLDL